MPRAPSQSSHSSSSSPSSSRTRSSSRFVTSSSTSLAQVAVGTPVAAPPLLQRARERLMVGSASPSMTSSGRLRLFTRRFKCMERPKCTLWGLSRSRKRRGKHRPGYGPHPLGKGYGPRHLGKGYGPRPLGHGYGPRLGHGPRPLGKALLNLNQRPLRLAQSTRAKGAESDWILRSVKERLEIFVELR